MKKNQSLIWMAAGILLLVLAALFLLLQPRTAPLPDEVMSAGPSSSSKDTAPTAPPEQPDDDSQPAAEDEPYVSPVDFEALWQQNSDIRAWFEIPGLDISAPIVCKDGDDAYYMRRDLEGNYYFPGTFFMESYNKFDFSDPVTLVYGHNMPDGGMFGNLQETYSNPTLFAEHNSFTVYTPTAEYEYQVFAAVPYGNEHILFYHDFYSFPVLEYFLNNIYGTRSLSANFDYDIQIEEGDKIVIFSTCQDGNMKDRYLMMGVWKDKTSAQ